MSNGEQGTGGSVWEQGAEGVFGNKGHRECLGTGG